MSEKNSHTVIRIRTGPTYLPHFAQRCDSNCPLSAPFWVKGRFLSAKEITERRKRK